MSVYRFWPYFRNLSSRIGNSEKEPSFCWSGRKKRKICWGKKRVEINSKHSKSYTYISHWVFFCIHLLIKTKKHFYNLHWQSLTKNKEPATFDITQDNKIYIIHVYKYYSGNVIERERARCNCMSEHCH